MTFERYLDMDTKEEMTPLESLKFCWDTAYSAGYTRGIADFMKSQNRTVFYDMEKQL